ncbi:hypothetical protein [Haloferax volcanii]|uniref:Uncharacterized protein n=1 Tax=Haloferax volcanii TaxID=2246 RepID=A0A8T5D046_HALVO|nr:hypothetical protein [Haloferax volcanii]MBS8119229.1 hypothetical protein [Haloferax volcanii]MBS8124242.1 hypothetical protein [Haloferax volcanii]MBS8128111.1 hypothetical protein [Haloferax volcanii]MBS8131976.1 hypothetical protein [Haloferax volcanii]MDW7536374.1 hypothetical protein [Haloferax volcanii]
MFWTGDTRCECFGSVPVLFAVVRSQPRHTADCDLVVAEAVAALASMLYLFIGERG